MTGRDANISRRLAPGWHRLARGGHSRASRPFISEALAVEGRGRDLFELMRSHDLESIVAKRLGEARNGSFLGHPLHPLYAAKTEASVAWRAERQKATVGVPDELKAAIAGPALKWACRGPQTP